MAEVRSTDSVAAVTGNFAGFGAPTPCSHLVFNPANGDLYVLLPGDVVTKIGSVAGGGDAIIASRVFSSHIPPNPALTLGDAGEIIAARVFGPRSASALFDESSTYIESRSFGRSQLPAMWR